jgi:shikimate kinase
MTTPRAVLIGPPGSGKSTVAAELAALWGVTACDTDEEIVAADGRDIPTIFVEDGEETFRRLERASVVACLDRHDGVLALGGGAVLDPATQGDLERYIKAGGEVIYLSVGASAAAGRVGLDGNRPLLTGNMHRRWVTLMNERRGTYERLATRTFETDESTAHEVALAIAEAVEAI